MQLFVSRYIQYMAYIFRRYTNIKQTYRPMKKYYFITVCQAIQIVKELTLFGQMFVFKLI